MSNIRDYQEQEFLAELKTRVPDKAMLQRIENLYERDHTAIERHEDALYGGYRNAVRALRFTCELAGIDQNTLLSAVTRASTSTNMTWYEVLGIVQSFYVQLRQVEKEQNG